MGKSLGEGLRGFKQSITGETQAAELTSEQLPAGRDEPQKA